MNFLQFPGFAWLQVRAEHKDKAESKKYKLALLDHNNIRKKYLKP